MYKYLYGKWEHLESLVNGSGQLRLCDIRHYVRLKNENMKDNEEVKHFEFSPDSFGFSFGGIKVNPESIIGNIDVYMPVQNCLCICFSNKKDDPELFEKFNADVCIEFNVKDLIDFLKYIFEKRIDGKVIARDVKYYDQNAGLDHLPAEEAVFTKSITYAHEGEYRIAAFLPQKLKVRCECHQEKIASGNCDCYFAFIDTGLDDGFKSYIGNIKKLTNPLCAHNICNDKC